MRNLVGSQRPEQSRSSSCKLANFWNDSWRSISNRFPHVTWPRFPSIRKQSMVLLTTLDSLKNVLQELQAKKFAVKATYQALVAQKQIKPKAEQQWQVVLPQPPRWPAVWSACHKGLNTGLENEVSYLAAHRVVKTAAYLKFKCGMKTISEFCEACGQIEDLEHVFIQCEITERVWKEFIPILNKILPGELFTDAKVLFLRDFQTNHPKQAIQLAIYLMKMILHKVWLARCACLFEKSRGQCKT